MSKAEERDSTEKLQITILTLAMTGGGFGILTLLFTFFLNPGLAEEATALRAEYDALTKLLQSQEMRELRANAKRQEGQDPKAIGEVVLDGLTRYGLEYPNFPSPQTKTLKAGLEEVTQKIDVKPASLLKILQFVAYVKEFRQTIRVESLTIARDTKVKDPDADSWTGSIQFVDYSSK